jgi:predicted nuclease of predicted toxin-antitoxin system
MQCLLNANLSYRLVKQLTTLLVAVLHGSRTGLPAPADDRQIWDWARTNGYVVLTNDDDFYRLAGTYGFPPKLVMLRTGNQSTRYLADLPDADGVGGFVQADEVGEEVGHSGRAGRERWRTHQRAPSVGGHGDAARQRAWRSLPGLGGPAPGNRLIPKRVN